MNTTTQKLAAVFGVVFILVAIAGFIAPGGMTMQPTDPATSAQALGMFPVNLLHNCVHLLFGLWGLAASRGYGASVLYARIGGVAYLLLAVIGFFMPELPGLMPIGGYDVWLHLVLGVALAAVGFTAREPVHTVNGGLTH